MRKNTMYIVLILILMFGITGCGSNKVYENGEMVFFNVTTGKKCSSADYVEAFSNDGVNEGCMKFYAFNDDENSKTVSLILDHNTTNHAVYWNSNRGEAEQVIKEGPKDAIEQLKKDTENWKGTETPTNYTNKKYGYTIDYSNLNARLITAEEIAKITGNSSFDENDTDYFYFDSNTKTPSSSCTRGVVNGCKYGWLYDRTYTNCLLWGCLSNSTSYTYGYLTATAFIYEDTVNEWLVRNSGGISFDSLTDPNGDGLRPVIEVKKSKLS